MRVRTIRDEIINLRAIKEYQLNDNVLVVKDGDKKRIYTLTDESLALLKADLHEVK